MRRATTDCVAVRPSESDFINGPRDTGLDEKTLKWPPGSLLPNPSSTNQLDPNGNPVSVSFFYEFVHSRGYNVKH